MRIEHVIQGTDDWLKLRAGKITGTRLKSVMGSPKVQETLIYELIAEEMTGMPEEIYQNSAMKWGSEHEDMAIDVYEQKFGVKTEVVGFCLSSEFDFVGLSPDRLIKKGKQYVKGVEVKAPTTKTVVKYLLDRKVPDDYKWQVVHYFLVVNTLKELDFVIYDPRIINTPELQLSVVYVTKDMVADDVALAKERLVDFREQWVSVKQQLWQ